MDKAAKIEALENTIEEQNKMLEHLHGRVQNHTKERNMMIDVNECLEKEINEKEEDIKKIRKELDEKENRLNVFEAEFEIEYDETIKIRDRAEIFRAEALEYKKKLEKTEFKLNSMEKKKEISDKLIKTLQIENSTFKEKLKDRVYNKSKSVEVDRLLEEIELIQKENKEKEDALSHVVKEKEMLQEDLLKLEKEKETLKEQLDSKDTETEHVQNLSDELGILDPHSHNVSPACKPCDEVFEKTNDVKSHDTNHHGGSLVKKIWKLKVLQLEKSINSQKLKIASNIIQLKEKEVSENRKCACKRFCRIVHQKYNWKKLFSEEIFNRFQML